jgi:hypothetical protein
MRSSNGSARRTVDWRDWVAFLGYVLATAVAVSVALASVVLLLSTQADDPSSGFADSPSQRPLPPAVTMLRRGPAPAPASTVSAVPSKTAASGVARVQGAGAESAAKLPPAPVPDVGASNPALGSSSTGLPDAGEPHLGVAAILQPIPEPSPTAAAILQPGSASLDTAAGSVVDATATIDTRTGFPAGASTTGG